MEASWSGLAPRARAQMVRTGADPDSMRSRAITRKPKFFDTSALIYEKNPIFFAKDYHERSE
tara:strand:+ start:2464 stop:2649 length:186 start_codon:yes stop_codon:yes gene_type:complete